MRNDELIKYVESRNIEFYNHYESSESKYEQIWNIYTQRMPDCVTNCQGDLTNYGENVWFDGPQGIYWIGKNPKIMFVGREHYGWYGQSKWPIDKHNICYAPLEFSFYTISSMGSYWGVVKNIIEDTLMLDLYDWNSVLNHVAFTNACKCLTNSGSYQWKLHQECIKNQYLKDEILTVNAKINVLFTKSYELIPALFVSDSKELFKTNEFVVNQLEDQILIECAHPGRQSNKWRDDLKNLILQYL
jgi:hypothetical protein